MGDYVSIGDDCVIQAAHIGSYCEIGKGCVIGPFTIIKDGCKILDGTIIPPLSVIAPYSLWGCQEGDYYGSFIEPLSESWPTFCKDRAEQIYDKHFQCYGN